MRTISNFLVAFVAVALLGINVSCGKDDDNSDNGSSTGGDLPSQQEKYMIPEEMTWTLDSVLVINNYQTPDETSVMHRASDGIMVVSYTFYPCTYRFPDDMFFIFDMTGDTLKLAELYNEDYCKYVTTYQGEVVAAGYLRYRNDMFTFEGLQAGGWVEMMMREADTDWNVQTWICAFDASVEHDGTVTERHIEYYSRTDK